MFFLGKGNKYGNDINLRSQIKAALHLGLELF